MDRKNEKTIVTLCDEELSTVAGAGDINVDMFNAYAFADHGSQAVATTGSGNQVYAHQEKTSLAQLFDLSTKFIALSPKV